MPRALPDIWLPNVSEAVRSSLFQAAVGRAWRIMSGYVCEPWPFREVSRYSTSVVWNSSFG